MYLEFVVLGPPVSNQSQGANLQSWKMTVKAQAALKWKNRPPLVGRLKAIIINFHSTSGPSLDLDNMSKPILDEMQNVVYEDDRQIRQLELTHEKIDAPFVIVGASPLLLEAVRAGNQFVYVRIDEPVDPLPLPKGHHGL